MHLAVYVPLLAAVGAGPLSRRLHQWTTTWVLTEAAVALAAATDAAARPVSRR